MARLLTASVQHLLDSNSAALASLTQLFADMRSLSPPPPLSLPPLPPAVPSQIFFGTVRLTAWPASQKAVAHAQITNQQQKVVDTTLYACTLLC